MLNIHGKCNERGKMDGYVSYFNGANVAGSVKVADAMVGYGAV